MVADLNLESAMDAANAITTLAANAKFSSAACAVDVSLETSVEAMVRETLTCFGRIDTSVHCAGVSKQDRAPNPEC